MAQSGARAGLAQSLLSPRGGIWLLSPQIPAKTDGGHSQGKPRGEAEGIPAIPDPMGSLCLMG